MQTDGLTLWASTDGSSRKSPGLPGKSYRSVMSARRRRRSNFVDGVTQIHPCRCANQISQLLARPLVSPLAQEVKWFAMSRRKVLTI